MIVVERVLAILVAVFVFTQMVLPPLLGQQMFPMFRRKKRGGSVRLRLAEERRIAAEEELAAAKAEAEALRLEAEAQKIEDDNIDKMTRK